MKIKKMKAGRGGWSEWVYPTEKYLFKCCDCSLIHEIEFSTFLPVSRGVNRKFVVLPMPKEVRVMFRARRYPISKKVRDLVIKPETINKLK